MSDDTTNAAELELLRAQRAQLANRLKPPWWYVAAIASGWAVAFAMPIGSHYLTGAGIGSSLLAIVVLLPIYVPELGLLDRVEAAVPFAQGGQIVAARPEMDAHLLVPMGTVDRSPR